MGACIAQATFLLFPAVLKSCTVPYDCMLTVVRIFGKAGVVAVCPTTEAGGVRARHSGDGDCDVKVDAVARLARDFCADCICALYSRLLKAFARTLTPLVVIGCIANCALLPEACKFPCTRSRRIFFVPRWLITRGRCLGLGGGAEMETSRFPQRAALSNGLDKARPRHSCVRACHPSKCSAREGGGSGSEVID